MLNRLHPLWTTICNRKSSFKEGGPQGNAIVVGGIFDLHGTANQKASFRTGYNFVDFKSREMRVKKGSLTLF